MLPNPFIIQRIHIGATSKRPPRLQLRPPLTVENGSLDEDEYEGRMTRLKSWWLESALKGMK